MVRSNITVYHEYASAFEYLGLANQNTGDLRGDAFFVLRSLLLPLECTASVPRAHFDCSNPEENGTSTNVVSEHIVMVNTPFGTYARCNEDVAHQSYSCDCGDHPSPIPCTSAAVGRADVRSRYNGHAPAPGDPCWAFWRLNLALKTGGTWYSTLEAGECRADLARPCFWRVLRNGRRIRALCLVSRVRGAIEAHNRTCFEACAQPRNASTPCYIGCAMSTLLGAAAATRAVHADEGQGMPFGVIESVWRAAFSPPASGGCPDAGLLATD